MIGHAKKVSNLIERVRACLRDRRYLVTAHLFARERERQITHPELWYVLKTGHHEAAKDRYDRRFDTWKYALRGRSVDGRLLRVIVAFAGQTLIVITAMDIGDKLELKMVKK